MHAQIDSDERITERIDKFLASSTLEVSHFYRGQVGDSSSAACCLGRFIREEWNQVSGIERLRLVASLVRSGIVGLLCSSVGLVITRGFLCQDWITATMARIRAHYRTQTDLDSVLMLIRDVFNDDDAEMFEAIAESCWEHIETMGKLP